MKAKTNPFLSISRLAITALLGLGASASAAVNNWNTTTGTWDTGTANWSSPTTWTNGNDAVFSNTATASIITLSSGLTAGSVRSATAATTRTTLSLARRFAFGHDVYRAGEWWQQSRHATPPPRSTMPASPSAAISASGVPPRHRRQQHRYRQPHRRRGHDRDRQRRLGQVTIQDTANVTATNGIVGGTTAWGLNLNGGTLTTKGIDYGPHSYSGTTNLNFNGTLVKANQDNANFITVARGTGFWLQPGHPSRRRQDSTPTATPSASGSPCRAPVLSPNPAAEP